jgi:uncharacterized DUF497 family protein
MYCFRWNDWNLTHIAEHNVEAKEAVFVVNHARRPWPEYVGNGKWRVWGPTAAGRPLQVIYVIDADLTLFVIHARDLNSSEKQRYRRRKR